MVSFISKVQSQNKDFPGDFLRSSLSVHFIGLQPDPENWITKWRCLPIVHSPPLLPQIVIPCMVWQLLGYKGAMPQIPLPWCSWPTADRQTDTQMGPKYWGGQEDNTTYSNEKLTTQGVVRLDWSLQESKIGVPNFAHWSGMSERWGRGEANLQKGTVGSGQALDLVEKSGWSNTRSTNRPSGFQEPPMLSGGRCSWKDFIIILVTFSFQTSPNTESTCPLAVGKSSKLGQNCNLSLEVTRGNCLRGWVTNSQLPKAVSRQSQ